MTAILTGVRQCFSVVSVCISLMSKALSISSCPTDCLYISSADTSVQLLCPFSTELFAFLLLSSKVRGNHTLESLKQKAGHLSFHCQTRVPAVCRLPLSPISREDRAQLPLGGSVQFSSVAQLCPTLCDPMDCGTPGFLVHHQLLELAQIHVHQVGDVIQPCHPLSSPSPPACKLSQHQSLFQ